jgi:uridylate kinase
VDMNAGKKASPKKEGGRQREGVKRHLQTRCRLQTTAAFKQNVAPYTIISLGGSLVVPGEIDIPFLKGFRNLILSHVKKGQKFIIIVGGGKTCRKYQAAASQITKLRQEDLDWLGIHSTRLNAHLLRTIFRDISHPVIIKDPTQEIKANKPVIIAAGWKPGCSTDHDAVLLARSFNSKVVLNLSDIDYVYDKDPDLDRNAKPLERMSWKEFRRLVGNKWQPGVNAPFDPVASKEAQRLGLQVIITNGKDFPNLEKILSARPFKGTVIQG